MFAVWKNLFEIAYLIIFFKKQQNNNNNTIILDSYVLILYVWHFTTVGI